MRTTTFEDLIGENAMAVLGTISGLLKQVERQLPSHRGLSDQYMEEAMGGDYDHLLRVSHKYAQRYAASTLQVKPDFEDYEVAVDDDGY